MLKKHTIYENKLSEQVSNDNNPLKQKLIDMETPTDKHPVYSFLSIGLLLYVWMFLIALVYNKAYGYQLAIAVVLFTTFCFAIVYKKPYLTNSHFGYEKIIYFAISIITILFSIVIAFADREKLAFSDLGKIFLFFLETNKKSYIAISVLAFLYLGIAVSYYKCPYEIYRDIYSAGKTYNMKSSVNQELNKYFRLSVFVMIFCIILLHLTFNPTTTGRFGFLFKILSMLVVFYVPSMIITGIEAKRYLKTFEDTQFMIVKTK